MKTAATLLLGLVLLAALGCQSWDPLRAMDGVKRPKAALTHIAIMEQTSQGARVELSLKVTNPNDVPLPLTTADLTVSFSDAAPFQLKQHVNRTLPPHGSQTIILPAAFALNAPLAGRDYNIHGRISYQPPETFIENLMEETLPLPSSHFAAAGSLVHAAQ